MYLKFGKVLMLPEKLVYAIERQKFGAMLVLYGAVLAIALPLMAGAHQIIKTSRVSAAPARTELALPALSHTVVTIDPSKPSAVPAVTGKSVWPLQGRVTTEFGVPHRPWQDTHSGIDITSGQPRGRATVAAFRDGTVIRTVRSGSGYGNHIIIDHGNGLTSLYAHLSAIHVSEGQRVAAGTPIGQEGSTGASTGAHLHFEIRENNSYKSPRRFIIGNPY